MAVTLFREGVGIDQALLTIIKKSTLLFRAKLIHFQNKMI